MKMRKFIQGTTKYILPAIFLSILAALLFCSYYTVYVAREDSHKSSESRINAFKSITYSTEVTKCMALRLSQQKYCLVKAAQELRDLERDERGLLAQEMSARWAFGASWVALIGVILSGFGYYYVWKTFQETKASNFIAKEAGKQQATAAREANRLAKEAIHATSRPFVIVTSNGNNLTDWLGNDTHFEWSFSIINFGNTPAIIRSVSVKLAQGTDISCLEREHERKLSKLSGMNIGIAEGAILPPGERISPGNCNTIPRIAALDNPVDIRRQMDTGDRGVYMRVFVVYDDLFNFSHETCTHFKQVVPYYKMEEVGGPDYNYRT